MQIRTSSTRSSLEQLRMISTELADCKRYYHSYARTSTRTLKRSREAAMSAVKSSRPTRSAPHKRPFDGAFQTLLRPNPNVPPCAQLRNIPFGTTSRAQEASVVLEEEGEETHHGIWITAGGLGDH